MNIQLKLNCLHVRNYANEDGRSQNTCCCYGNFVPAVSSKAVTGSAFQALITTAIFFPDTSSLRSDVSGYWGTAKGPKGNRPSNRRYDGSIGIQKGCRKWFPAPLKWFYYLLLYMPLLAYQLREIAPRCCGRDDQCVFRGNCLAG